MALASAGGGLAQAAVGNPLRVWKNQLQLGQLKGSWQDQWRQVPMFAGMGLFCATAVVSNMWCYTAQHVLRQALEKRDVRPHLAGMVSGAAAGATEALLSNPVRRVLVMQQAPGGARLGFMSAVRQVLLCEGWSGLYAGAGIGAVRNGVGCGVFFPLAASLRGKPHERSYGRDVAAAVVAAAAAAALVQPLDTVISCMQGSARRTTAQGVLRRIVAQDGARGLMRGLMPTMMQVVPGSAVAFVITMALMATLSQGSNDDEAEAARSASGPPSN